MSTPSTPKKAPRSRPRWALPATVATAVVGGTLLVPAVASAEPELPPTTAAELLEDVATADQQSFSGTVVQSTDLGLPELPDTGGQGGSELTSLLGGSTTLRVWADGPDRGRVAVLGALAETDVVRDGRDVWVWRSDSQTAQHATLPEDAAEREQAPDPTATTPADAAEQALAAVDPTTEVTLDGTATVADRDAYELVLTPRDGDSLVGQVRLAVDAETSFPLRAQVFARGAGEPAFETGFTSISYDAPGAEVFAFDPPPGTTVEELPTGELEGPDAGVRDGLPQQGAPGEAPEGAEGAEPTTVGEGWTAVTVLRGTSATQAFTGGAAGGDRAGDGGEADPTAQALLGAFQPVQGAYGSGRVLSTSLVSVLALDDGRVLVGAVEPAALEAAALDPAAAP